MNITFAECIESRKGIQCKIDHFSAILNSFPVGNMGLIPDCYKKTEEYINADNQFKFWFNQLRELNSYLVKNHKKELYELRKKRYEKTTVCQNYAN